jgi:hypothetical protein
MTTTMTTRMRQRMDETRLMAKLYELLREDAEKLRGIARRLHLLSAANCNGHPNEVAQKGANTRTMRLKAEAGIIAEDHGLYIYFQNDPRGCPLCLVDSRDNSIAAWVY